MRHAQKDGKGALPQNRVERQKTGLTILVDFRPPECQQGREAGGELTIRPIYVPGEGRGYFQNLNSRWEAEEEKCQYDEASCWR